MDIRQCLAAVRENNSKQMISKSFLWIEEFTFQKEK